MSVLNNADEIKIGNQFAKYVYLGDEYIWPPIPTTGFWTFDEMSSTVSIALTFSQSNYKSMIFWGDGTYDRASNAQLKSHTYL